ncbi:MAG: UPF0280 family protein [Actinobacteria bacterium]|nr:UPF0280 family protein [Actinomycetota bacterium]
MLPEENLLIQRLFGERLFIDKDIYRIKVNVGNKFSWKVSYKYSDLFIVSKIDIYKKIIKLLPDFYRIIQEFIKKYPSFAKTLNSFNPKDDFPDIIKKMCQSSVIFKVGPMASVAGAVCQYLAQTLSKNNPYLSIENGGDIYIKSPSDIVTGLFLNNKYFKDNIKIKIKKDILPCGIASSSGTLGHSLSLGKSDLTMIICKSPVLADAAATAVGNMVTTKDDIQKTINYFKKFEEILAIIIIKDDKIGLYGDIELV